MFSYPKLNFVFVLCCGLALLSCNKTHRGGETRILELMEIQENDWNRGDIPSFMKTAYVDSDSLMFIGKSGLNMGYQATLANYLKSYPNAEQMGKLAFENIRIKALGTDHYFVVGKWELKRINDTIGGHYSLVWQWHNGDWKIIADHSS